MSTQTERCFSRKSSGRWGQGIRLNQVNFTGILPRVPRRRGPNLTRSAGCRFARRPPAARAERVYLEVDAPHSGDLVREPIALVEVRGWVGTGLRGKHDVIIVLDRSASTFRASGMDVDGDGVGRPRLLDEPCRTSTRAWTSDFGDTIVSAELAGRAAPDRAARPRDHAHGAGQLRRQRRSSRRRSAARARSCWRRSTRCRPRPNENGTYIYGALEAAIVAFEAGAGRAAERRAAARDPAAVRRRPDRAAGPALRRAAHRGAGRAQRRARARAHLRFALGPIAARSRARTSRRSCARTAASCSCSTRRPTSSSSCPT